jgi:hypothetical protein
MRRFCVGLPDARIDKNEGEPKRELDFALGFDLARRAWGVRREGMHARGYVGRTSRSWLPPSRWPMSGMSTLKVHCIFCEL